MRIKRHLKIVHLKRCPYKICKNRKVQPLYDLWMTIKKKNRFIYSVFVYTGHFKHVRACVNAHFHYVYMCVCVQSKLRFNLLGEISMQSGQYQLLPQSQMEAGWGAGARLTKAAQSPNIIIGLREAIKPSLGRLPRLQPVYKPTAFCFVHLIFLSGLVRQHDRWFSLVHSSWFSSPGEPTDTFICHCLLQVCATTLGQRKKKKKNLLEWPEALISVCNLAVWTWAASELSHNRWRYHLAEQDRDGSLLQPVAPGEEWD